MHCVVVSLCLGVSSLCLMDLYECFRNQTWSFTSSPWRKGRHATSGSSQSPIPGLAFGQGFEIVQLSDQSKDTPSILLNSGEDECDSCLGLTFPVGSDPLPGWALFPRGHLLSLISPQGCYWSTVLGNPGCSLSWEEELCVMESPPGRAAGTGPWPAWGCPCPRWTSP